MVTDKNGEAPCRALSSRGDARAETGAVKDGRGGGDRLRGLLEAPAACANGSARPEADGRGEGPVEVRANLALLRSRPGLAVHLFPCRADGPMSTVEREALEEAARAFALGRILRRKAVRVEDRSPELAP